MALPVLLKRPGGDHADIVIKPLGCMARYI